jgi:hypothetical protein
MPHTEPKGQPSYIHNWSCLDGVNEEEGNPCMEMESLPWSGSQEWLAYAMRSANWSISNWWMQLVWLHGWVFLASQSGSHPPCQATPLPVLSSLSSYWLPSPLQIEFTLANVCACWSELLNSVSLGENFSSVQYLESEFRSFCDDRRECMVFSSGNKRREDMHYWVTTEMFQHQLN